MDTNIQTEKTTAKKVAAKKTPVETDPFASAVEEVPAKKRVAKKATQVKVDAAQVKKTVKKASKEIVLDPFAEVVDDAVSPVKKRVAKVVKPVAKKPAKTTKKNDEVDGVVKPKPVKKSSEKVESAVSPVFEALSDVSLPELPRENRARLQMQTPTRLYFYWSVKENPWALLKNVFGDDLGSYSLVLKLVDKKHGHEDIHPTDAAGNYWFDVDADGSYQAEIIDKVGGLVAGMTYGAKKDSALEHYQKAIKLNPDSAIARIEYANGLIMLFGKARMADAEKLYKEAAAHKPADAMERLDVELARSELS